VLSFAWDVALLASLEGLKSSQEGCRETALVVPEMFLMLVLLLGCGDGTSNPPFSFSLRFFVESFERPTELPVLDSRLDGGDFFVFSESFPGISES